MEILANIPDRISAMQKITVPYRITRRQAAAVSSQVRWTPKSHTDSFGESEVRSKKLFAFNSGLLTPDSSLLEEVMGFGGGASMGSSTVSSTWEYIICPDSENQRRVGKSSSHTIIYLIDPQEAGLDESNLGDGYGTKDTTTTYEDFMKKQFGNGIDIPFGSIPTAIPTGGAKCGANSSTACTNPDAVILVGQSGFTSGLTTQTSGTNAITILSPANWTTTDKSRIILTGIIDTTSQDIGITIQATTAAQTATYPAQRNRNAFAAKIDLQQGANAIKVIATDQNANKTEATITITGTATAPDKITLSASPSSGTPTLPATIGVTTYIQNPITKYAYDFNGNGTTDVECSDLIGLTVNYKYPGLYLPTATVTDNQGNTYTDTAIVNVLNGADMDTGFKGIWDKMKARLKEGDVEGAVGYYAEDSKDSFRQQFTALSSLLSQIVGEMGNIALIKATAISIWRTLYFKTNIAATPAPKSSPAI